MLTLREFLDDNNHRSYPFRENNALPNNIILDGHFLVTGNISKDNLYIDKVIITDSYIEIVAAAVVDGLYTTLGTLLVADLRPYYTYTVSLVNQNNRVLIDGNITLGEIDKSQIGVYALGESGRIFEGCVVSVTNWCTGISINGKLYTGIVNLVFDSSFSIYTEGSDIVISLPSYRVSAPSVDVDTLINNIGIEKPILTINGIKADAETGNITIEAVDPDVTAVESLVGVNGETLGWPTNNKIVITSDKANTITIKEEIPAMLYDPNKKFAEQDASVQALIDNCEELDNRLQSIESHLVILENAQNMLNTQLTRG